MSSDTVTIDPDFGLQGPKAMAPELHWLTGIREHEDRVRELIRDYQPRSICEIGGGRSPLFGPEEVTDLGVDYTILDISDEELELAPPGLHTLCGDICDDEIVGDGSRFDFMFSSMVAEHVRDGDLMHRNIFSMLKPGGVAFHYMPTLFYPVFAANRVMPQRLSTWALKRFADRPSPKFPARYSKCMGPTDAMRTYLMGVGYEVVEYRPFYGSVYFEFMPGVRQVERSIARWAAQRRNPWLTSFAYLVVRKPGPRAGLES